MLVFLGFLGANVSYRLFSTYKHRVLFVGSSLITFLFIVSGQTIVEHIFQTQTTLGVVIDFIGGLYFVFLLMKERA
ncbi:MAG TPA: iron chelate uptake ABC transporter family permease subunit [Gallicola sp.]|uniref:iron chelate uptake ABC transporter family permease subunit n=1 Tax=Atopostipes suicloacalis TaxID=180295 RepID=UPI0017B01925|nr:iron chelate uptake ABC transporter family permease subunit [Atopostipes suicloacalis]HHX66903.1 iron chelate uptake ABC transporter family permease subunit [Gallicola sp.]